MNSDQEIAEYESEEGNTSDVYASVAQIDIAEQDKTKKELQESEARFRALVMASAQIVWRANAQGVVDEDLPMWRIYTGQRIDDIEQFGWRDAIHPDDQEQVYQTWSNALTSKSLFETECRLRRYDGVYRIFSMRGVPVLEADGSIREWVGTCTDITERKRAEQRLAVQYALSRELVEAINLDDASLRILQTLGEGLNWDMGLLWTIDQRSNVLRCSKIWHSSSIMPGEFEEISRKIHFPLGVGLPGRVWAKGEPAWISDVTRDSNFPRLEPAAREGFHGAFAFPICGHNRILGVIEFFSHEIRSLPQEEIADGLAPLENNLRQTLMTIGNQIGQFYEVKLVEEAMRSSEARKGSIVEMALDAIITIDQHGRVIEFNPAAENMFGYNRIEVLGQQMGELIIPPGLREQHYKGLARYLATGEENIIGKRIELEAMAANGITFPVELTITRIPLDGPPLFTGYIRNITARRELEDALLKTAQLEKSRASQLETIIEAMADGVFIYDKDGGLLTANRTARELFALDTQPDYATHPVRERVSQTLVRNEQGQLLPEEQWPMLRILQGEVFKGTETIDVIIRALNGQDVHLAISGSPIYDAEGQISGGVLILRDVTERRQIEQHRHNVLNALLEMAESLVLIPDLVSNDHEHAESNQGNLTTSEVAHRVAELTCRVLNCMRVSITAVETETEILRPVTVVGLSVEQEEQWWIEQRQQEVSLRDIPVPELASLLRADEALVIDMTKPPFNAQPNPYGIHRMLMVPMSVGSQLIGLLSLDYANIEHIYTSEDIALAKAVGKLAALVIERERLLRERAQASANELALREANRRMDEFLGMASHELRTPLTTIKGNVQLATRQIKLLSNQQVSAINWPKKLEAIKGHLERTDRQVSLLTRLVSDLLDVSRIQSGKLELRLDFSDLLVVMRETVQNLQQLFPGRSIQLLLPELERLPVSIDADGIAQVLTNYLTNALKYSAPEFPVEVRLELEESSLRVSVRDQGPGLPLVEQEHVWERFYRAPEVQVQSGSKIGLGLGLYISRSIVERHGGQVGVDSLPNQGATFWFTLPLTDDGASSS